MVYVVGHRGAAAIMPENTIKGFRYAIELGVDYVECDVHLSRDHQVVVMHDATVDRTTNGRGAIRDLTLARIRTLDAGQGERVPTLDEVMETVRGEAHLLIELKGIGVERAAVEAVKAQGMQEYVTFISFSLDRLALVREMGEDYRLGAILPNPTEFDLARAVEMKAIGIDIQYSNLCFRHVEAAHSLGLEVRAWNPDTWDEQQTMIALGVDGVSTNRPDILLSNLGRQVGQVVLPDDAVDNEFEDDVVSGGL
jgi:glycerophosphoryl diester phosphodiesterase